MRRALEGQTVVDSSWALAHQGEGRFDREHLIGATLPQTVAWIGGTAIGVTLGTGADVVERFGLDVIFPAFFAALLVEEIRSGGRATAVVATVAAIIALILIPLAPAGVPVIAASAAALLGMWRVRT